MLPAVRALRADVNKLTLCFYLIPSMSLSDSAVDDFFSVATKYDTVSLIISISHCIYSMFGYLCSMSDMLFEILKRELIPLKLVDMLYLKWLTLRLPD